MLDSSCAKLLTQSSSEFFMKQPYAFNPLKESLTCEKKVGTRKYFPVTKLKYEECNCKLQF